MPHSFHWIVSEMVGNVLPFPQQQRKVPQPRSTDCREQCGKGKQQEVPNQSKGRGAVTPNSRGGACLSGTAAWLMLFVPASLLHSNDLSDSLDKEGKGTNKFGDIIGRGEEEDVGRSLGEQNSQAWGGLQGSSQQ